MTNTAVPVQHRTAETAEIVHSLATGWQEISMSEVGNWNQRLLQANAPLFQLPFWNEPFRQLHFTPRYLAYVEAGERTAYTCILTAGLPGFRIGLIQRGPVALVQGAELNDSMLKALRAWASGHGYVFLRFTHPDAAHMELLAAQGKMERQDAFPFYRDLRDELIVSLEADETELQAGFQAVARRKIKHAQNAPYEIRSSDAPETLTAVWPLFERLGARKGFRFRPLASFLQLVELARVHQCVRLYVAYLAGQAVEAILILQDRQMAYYLIGALDTAAMGEHPSPSCLLHWLAMCESRQAGRRAYHLGTRSGKVYAFKRQFRPSETTTPPPVTWIIKPVRYQLWARLALQYLPAFGPRLKRLLFGK